MHPVPPSSINTRTRRTVKTKERCDGRMPGLDPEPVLVLARAVEQWGM